MHALTSSAAAVVALLFAGCAASPPSPLMNICPVPQSRTVVSGDVLSRSGSTTLSDALQGRVAGLTFSVDRTGRRTASIRGRSSFQRAEPLVVVDEVWQATRGVSALDRINTMEVAYVEVLKDSDASARFGGEGGSGVILITTRRSGCDATATRDPRPPADRRAQPSRLPPIPARRPIGVTT